MTRRDPLTIARPPESERGFTGAVVEAALWCGWLAYHPWRSDHSAAGWPDLALCRPPRLILAELKTDRGRPTVAQRVWLDALAACPGVEAVLWKPADWAAIVEALR